jgi:hypothetical protein
MVFLGSSQCNACTTHRGAPQRTCAELLFERALARRGESTDDVGARFWASVASARIKKRSATTSRLADFE